MNHKERKIYEEKILPLLKHPVRVKRFWELSTAYLLPKNKDTNKTRPLVSYFNHYSKTLGKRVARALTVAIKTLAVHWNTSELPNADNLPVRLGVYSSNNADVKTTFLKFDIKNQFTNLSKVRVKKALEYALSYLASHAAKRKLCFCIRTREYEKRYDHIGHPYKYKEMDSQHDL